MGSRGCERSEELGGREGSGRLTLESSQLDSGVVAG